MKEKFAYVGRLGAAVIMGVFAGPVAACAETEKGPGTTAADFFGKYVDCSMPALGEIPAKMAAGDTNAANRIFADYVRAMLVLDDGTEVELTEPEIR